ncbi:hypothetical protein R0J91_20365, partial [Micrococcus sp. SIMBA_131]
MVLVDANFRNPFLSLQAANSGPKAGLSVYHGDEQPGDPPPEKRRKEKQTPMEDGLILPVLTVEQIRKAAHPGHR